MPQTPNGSPKIGNFPYHSGDITGSTSFSFRIPLSDFGLTGDETSCDPITLYIAAHAVVLRDSDGDGDYDESETAWGDGDPFVERGTWAMYFSGELTCSGDDPPGGGDCETAFAYGDSQATCFLDIDQDGDGSGDFNRWGWTGGPLAPGTYVWDVYAGAGQCDLNKGTVVGTLTVDYDGSVATASFQMNPPYTMSDAHLYIGNELLPTDVNGNYTVAPGQNPQVFDFTDAPTSHSFDDVSVSGDAFVVAHTTVCGF
jgi:hypothetical protein